MQLDGDSKFAIECDFSVRTFGDFFMYVIDGNLKNLHIYHNEKRLWNFSKLKDLGVQF